MAAQGDEGLRHAWLARVLGVNLPEVAAPGNAKPSRKQGLALLTKRGAEVVGSLTALERAIRAMRDPEGDRAVILVRAIAANLTAEPATCQSVTDVRRYLEQYAPRQQNGRVEG